MAKEVDDKVAEEVSKAETKARNDATAETMARFAALNKAFPDDPAFAAEQFSKGHDVTQAKAEYADKLAEKVAALEKEKADAAEKAQNAASAPGVDSAKGFDRSGAQAAADEADFMAKARAISIAERIPLAEAQKALARHEPDLYAAYRETLRVVNKK